MNLKSGGLHEKHAAAAWNLATITEFAHHFFSALKVYFLSNILEM
jgi:hypothetical protein